MKASDPFIVMEWMAGGSWFDALGEDPPPPAYQRIRAARETASALAYLHHVLIGIIHGDIKGLNVLRARDGSSKVPAVRASDCGYVSRRTLNPVQGLKRGRDGGEVKVMTGFRA